MGRIEQAVFTSARTDRGVGYQIVATSKGVGEVHRRELAVWGPSHDSLLETGADAASFNFFPLSGGTYCISRTTAIGWEYSGRGGARVYTHCLVVHADSLRQFANHPLRLAWAAAAAGIFNVRGECPAALDSLDLEAISPVVTQASFAESAERVDDRRVAPIVQSVLTAACTVVHTGEEYAEDLIAGVFEVLPIERRPAISFSTGLRYSSRRPFRLLRLADDPATRRWLARQPNVTVLDSDAHRALPTPLMAAASRL